MISEDEALEKILARVSPMPSRIVPLAEALGCFVARDMAAKLPLPLFDNSAMDGYAVKASSCAPDARLRVVGEQPAGVDRELRAAAMEAIRIFTGAPIPAGTDAVVMQEEVVCDGAEIVLNGKVATGEYVRRRGCDLTDGQKILAAGERIRPQSLALLASQGFAEVEVGGKVRTTIVSTGDELVRPGETLRPGQLYESNSLMLSALLQECGASVSAVHHSRDEPESIEATLRSGLADQALVISGGVSVGERDAVKGALKAVGAEIDLWRVSVKPGKPFLFGRAGDCAIFGLPGNPVSAFVTFLLFVRPAILKMLGAGESELHLPRTPAQLTRDLKNDGDRPHYVRGILENGTFTPFGRQESHALYGLSRSNALLRVAPGEEIHAGAVVEIRTWN